MDGALGVPGTTQVSSNPTPDVLSGEAEEVAYTGEGTLWEGRGRHWTEGLRDKCGEGVAS